MKRTNRFYTKIALLVSLILLLIWSVLGMGSSLAWFADTSPALRNNLQFGDLSVAVSHKTEDGYRPVTAQTHLFDEAALYEPGYVQLVYLKIENNGSVPFRYRVAVTVHGVTDSHSATDAPLHLPDYLRFGAVFGGTEFAGDRSEAEALATAPLGTQALTDTVTVPAGGTRYVALVLTMPTWVANEANYVGTTPPTVDLGVAVIAEQLH